MRLWRICIVVLIFSSNLTCKPRKTNESRTSGNGLSGGCSDLQTIAQDLNKCIFNLAHSPTTILHPKPTLVMLEAESLSEKILEMDCQDPDVFSTAFNPLKSRASVLMRECTALLTEKVPLNLEPTMALRKNGVEFNADEYSPLVLINENNSVEDNPDSEENFVKENYNPADLQCTKLRTSIGFSERDQAISLDKDRLNKTYALHQLQALVSWKFTNIMREHIRSGTRDFSKFEGLYKQNGMFSASKCNILKNLNILFGSDGSIERFYPPSQFVKEYKEDIHRIANMYPPRQASSITSSEEPGLENSFKMVFDLACANVSNGVELQATAHPSMVTSTFLTHANMIGASALFFDLLKYSPIQNAHTFWDKGLLAANVKYKEFFASRINNNPNVDYSDLVFSTGVCEEVRRRSEAEYRSENVLGSQLIRQLDGMDGWAGLLGFFPVPVVGDLLSLTADIIAAKVRANMSCFAADIEGIAWDMFKDKRANSQIAVLDRICGERLPEVFFVAALGAVFTALPFLPATAKKFATKTGLKRLAKDAVIEGLETQSFVSKLPTILNLGRKFDEGEIAKVKPFIDSIFSRFDGLPKKLRTIKAALDAKLPKKVVENVDGSGDQLTKAIDECPNCPLGEILEKAGATPDQANEASTACGI